MKKLFNILTASLLIIFMFTSFAFADGITLNIGGANEPYSLEIKDSRTYISDKDLEGIGLNGSINGNIVTAKNSNVIFKFILNTNKVMVNNIELTLDARSYKSGDRVYLPLRFILETLNYDIKWDGKNNTVKATKKADIGYPITIEENGITYKVEKEPNTIVSLAPDVTETLFAIGAGDKVKGRTKYCNYPIGVEKIKDVGSMTDPNIEVIVDINPGLVIAATHYKDEVLNKLKEAGISILAKASPNTLEEMYKDTLLLGAITNRNYEARALVSTMRSKVGTIEEKLRYVSRRPSIYYVVGTGQYGEYTAGGDTFISEAIKIAGGRNIADDISGWKYSIEKLIDNNPEYIFGSKFGYETMTTSDNYKSLSAIRNSRFVVVNEDIFSRPSPRLINEGLKILLEILHKDIVNGLDF